MAVGQDIIEELVGAIKQDPQIKNRTHSAVVSRIDDEGNAWVYVAGSEKETPTASTAAEVKRGDGVMVEWRNDRLYIVGNTSDPSAGRARVQSVEESAIQAGQAASRALVAADSALSSAATAAEAATRAAEDASSAATSASQAAASASSAASDASTAATAAQAAQAEAASASSAATAAQTSASNAATSASNAASSASSAATSASQAASDASSAKASAANASEYAARALGNLSTVQSVAETLNWITAHGTMALTTDTALDPTHVYFVQKSDGDYVVGGVRYAVVSEPDVADISTYYELSIDESLNNYVATHLAVTSEGLWIIPDAGGNKVLIATGQGSTYTSAGTYIIGQVDGSDVVLASFLENGARIGQQGKSRLEITSNSLTAYNEESVSFFDVDYDGVQYEGEGAFTATFPNSIVGDFSPSAPYTVTKNYDVSEIPSGIAFTFSWTDLFLIALATTIDTENRQTSSGITYKRKRNPWLEYQANVIVQFSKGTSGSHEEYINLYDGSKGWRIVFAVNYDGNDTLSLIVRVTVEGASQDNEISIYRQTSTVTYRITTTAPSFVFGTNNSEQKGAFTSTLGEALIAEQENQTAIGKYNDNQSNTAFEIGNGTSTTARSNAFTVGWDGEVELALDTTATTGTDYELYQAITALGWESDVIV